MLGYACKTLDENLKIIAEYNFKTTTLKYLLKLNFNEQKNKLKSIVDHNLNAVENIIWICW